MNGIDGIKRAAEQVKKSMQRHRLLWLVVLAGLLLLFLPNGGQKKEEVQIAEPLSFDLAEMESRLAETLSQIEGAGQVTVMLTAQNSPRKLLAEDVEQGEKEEKRETVVLSRGGSTQETIMVQEVYPSYQGAVLVCKGGDNPHVRLQLTEATAALTGLGADKISISKGK